MIFIVEKIDKIKSSIDGCKVNNSNNNNIANMPYIT